MKSIFKGKSPAKKLKPIDEVEEEETGIPLSKFTSKQIKPKSTPTGIKEPIQSTTHSNRNLEEGKIHIEVLFSVFDRYRQNMNNTAYKAGQNPFLLERLIAELRAGLKKELTEMGFGDYIDFQFIPMPPMYNVAKALVRSSKKDEED